MEGRTTIAIAHRLLDNPCRGRDLVIEAGRLIEQGTHAEFAERGGKYAGLYAQQFAGGLVEARCENGVVLAWATCSRSLKAPSEVDADRRRSAASTRASHVRASSWSKICRASPSRSSRSTGRPAAPSHSPRSVSATASQNGMPRGRSRPPTRNPPPPCCRRRRGREAGAKREAWARRLGASLPVATSRWSPAAAPLAGVSRDMSERLERHGERDLDSLGPSVRARRSRRAHPRRSRAPRVPSPAASTTACAAWNETRSWTSTELEPGVKGEELPRSSSFPWATSTSEEQGETFRTRPAPREPARCTRASRHRP